MTSRWHTWQVRDKNGQEQKGRLNWSASFPWRFPCPGAYNIWHILCVRNNAITILNPSSTPSKIAKGRQSTFTYGHTPSCTFFSNLSVPTYIITRRGASTKNGGTWMDPSHSPSLRSCKRGPLLHPGADLLAQNQALVTPKYHANIMNIQKHGWRGSNWPFWRHSLSLSNFVGRDGWVILSSTVSYNSISFASCSVRGLHLTQASPN